MCTHSKILPFKIQHLTFLESAGLMNQASTIEIFGLQLVIISKIVKNAAAYVGIRPYPRYSVSGLIQMNVIRAKGKKRTFPGDKA